MKTLLIALGIVAVVGGVLLITVIVKVAGVVHEAYGQALYSSAGAWTRIQEFAHAEGKANYIAEADEMLADIEQDLEEWRAGADAADIARFEKMRTTAYETTDRNIKNGQNPLAYLDASQPDAPANGSPPIRLETDGTSSATGSDR